MMQATDLGNSDDLGLRRWSMLGGSAYRRILQLGVDSVVVVVIDIFPKKASKVVLVQDDHVIQQLPASAANPSLGNPILPWTSKGRSSRGNSNVLDRFGDPFREY